jgi:hypothetical protein
MQCVNQHLEYSLTIVISPFWMSKNVVTFCFWIKIYRHNYVFFFFFNFRWWIHLHGQKNLKIFQK